MQVRIEGGVEPVATEEADAYFATRPRGSQIGAWASTQSRPMLKREELDARVAEFEKKFAGQTVPRPAHWSGFRLTPTRIEFWKGMASRLHHRDLYVRGSDGSWSVQILYP
jgi:pyridoxamine 5'-phosphate oxidase